MSFVHGKSTIVKLNGKDLSAYTNTSSLTIQADAHDVTGYGKNAHVFNGGLLNATANLGGTYDNTATSGPRAAIEPIVGTTVAYIRQPEGAGTGKPQDSCNVVVVNYVETNPVADMITWSADLQVTDAINSAAQ